MKILCQGDRCEDIRSSGRCGIYIAWRGLAINPRNTGLLFRGIDHGPDHSCSWTDFEGCTPCGTGGKPARSGLLFRWSSSRAVPGLWRGTGPADWTISRLRVAPAGRDLSCLCTRSGISRGSASGFWSRPGLCVRILRKPAADMGSGKAEMVLWPVQYLFLRRSCA